jgi:glycosyltransferase involved in cell wall biosynthesis
MDRFGLPPERTCTIYNGVDVERFSPSERAVEGDEGGLQLLAVSALIREKGIDLLLRALAALGDVPWRLAVAGDGPARGTLMDLAKNLGIADRTRFLGLRDDVPGLLRTADIFVHPAIWQEALGNTVLEGMAAGCAVVASRVGGIPELARHGEEALLVEPTNVRELSDTLLRLAADPALRRRLGRAARARVVKDFSLASSISRHLDCCEAAVRGEFFT